MLRDPAREAGSRDPAAPASHAGSRWFESSTDIRNRPHHLLTLDERTRTVSVGTRSLEVVTLPEEHGHLIITGAADQGRVDQRKGHQARIDHRIADQGSLGGIGGPEGPADDRRFPGPRGPCAHSAPAGAKGDPGAEGEAGPAGACLPRRRVRRLQQRRRSGLECRGSPELQCQPGVTSSASCRPGRDPQLLSRCAVSVSPRTSSITASVNSHRIGFANVIGLGDLSTATPES